MVFGRKVKKVEENNTPDLVVPAGKLPKSIGMQGFTEDDDEVIEETEDEEVISPVYNPKKTPDPIAAIRKAVPKPEPEEAKEQFQIIAVELMANGLYRYIIVTNKILGDIGGVYDI